MTINERIRVLRKDNLHITQEAFGKPLGLTRANIANIEVGRISTTERVILSICKEFHIRERWLRYGEDPMYSLDVEEDPYSRAVAEIDVKDPRAKQAILDYWHLTPEDKELFWRFADRFLLNKSPED